MCAFANWLFKAERTLLTGFIGIIDELPRKGVTNSSVCYDRLRKNGFRGGMTIVEEYISSHKELVLSKRLPAVYFFYRHVEIKLQLWHDKTKRKTDEQDRLILY